MMTNDDEDNQEKQDVFKGRFRPTSSQLKKLAGRCAENLATMKEEELGEFVEVDESENGQFESYSKT